MHYLTYVFIPKNADIDEAVAKALAPFDEDLQAQPWKRHLDAGEIAAMAKQYSVRRTSLLKLAGCMEDWCGGTGGVDGKGLFVIHTYNPDGKWDWYEVGGRWNGFLRGNVRTAKSLLKSPRLEALLPHDFLTPDGTWHARARYVSTGWIKGHIVHKPARRWLDEFTTALAAWPHHRVVCVDRHC